MIHQLAWRNIWRNSLRSLVIMAAIAMGMVGGVFSLALYNGMTQQKVRSAIGTQTAHVQLHHRQFQEKRAIEHTLPNRSGLRELLQQHPEVTAFSERISVSGMAASSNGSGGIELLGIDPAQERQVSTIHSRLVEGTYFDSAGRKPLLIGKKLAEKLEVGLRSKVVVTLQDAQGHITGAAFRVVGIFQTSSSAFDGATAFVLMEDLNSIAALSGQIHEIALLTSDAQAAAALKSGLAEQVPEKVAVSTWKETQPELAYMSDAMAQTNFIFMIVILFALAFGILNTMLMAVFERVREIGVLMAVGMEKPRIFRLIVTETVYLSLLGAAFGLGLAVLLIGWTGQVGIPLDQFSEGFAAYGIDSTAYPELSPGFYVQMVVMVFFTALLSALYPAWKALRLHPVEAIRGDVA